MSASILCSRIQDEVFSVLHPVGSVICGSSCASPEIDLSLEMFFKTQFKLYQCHEELHMVLLTPKDRSIQSRYVHKFGQDIYDLPVSL